MSDNIDDGAHRRVRAVSWDEVGDQRRTAFSDVVADDVGPELLVCTALVRSGTVDGCGTELIVEADERIILATTDVTHSAATEVQWLEWEGPGPDVVCSGQECLVTDVQAEGARWPLVAPSLSSLPLRAFAALPLQGAAGSVGLFTAYRAEPRPFSGADLDALRAVAATLTVLVSARFGSVTHEVSLPPLMDATAVGQVMRRLGISASQAAALLESQAASMGVSVSDLAARVTSRPFDDDLLRRLSG